jgi:hypothetical protein
MLTSIYPLAQLLFHFDTNNAIKFENSKFHFAVHAYPVLRLPLTGKLLGIKLISEFMGRYICARSGGLRSVAPLVV